MRRSAQAQRLFGELKSWHSPVLRSSLRGSHLVGGPSAAVVPPPENEKYLEFAFLKNLLLRCNIDSGKSCHGTQQFLPPVCMATMVQMVLQLLLHHLHEVKKPRIWITLRSYTHN